MPAVATCPRQEVNHPETTRPKASPANDPAGIHHPPEQVDRVIGALLAMGPEAEALSDLLLPYCLVMSDLADAGLHDVAVDRCSEFVAALQQQDLRHGAMLDVMAAMAGGEPDVSEYLLRDTEFDTEFATLRQARAIITAAGAGLGEVVQAGGGDGS